MALNYLNTTTDHKRQKTFWKKYLICSVALVCACLLQVNIMPTPLFGSLDINFLTIWPKPQTDTLVTNLSLMQKTQSGTLMDISQCHCQKVIDAKPRFTPRMPKDKQTTCSKESSHTFKKYLNKKL
jgi:hypothetical protein